MLNRRTMGGRKDSWIRNVCSWIDAAHGVWRMRLDRYSALNSRRQDAAGTDVRIGEIREDWPVRIYIDWNEL